MIKINRSIANDRNDQTNYKWSKWTNQLQMIKMNKSIAIDQNGLNCAAANLAATRSIASRNSVKSRYPLLSVSRVLKAFIRVEIIVAIMKCYKTWRLGLPFESPPCHWGRKPQSDFGGFLLQGSHEWNLREGILSRERNQTSWDQRISWDFPLDEYLDRKKVPAWRIWTSSAV